MKLVIITVRTGCAGFISRLRHAASHRHGKTFIAVPYLALVAGSATNTFPPRPFVSFGGNKDYLVEGHYPTLLLLQIVSHDIAPATRFQAGVT